MAHVANPFSESKTFHKIGHLTNTTPLRLLPTPRGYAIITTIGQKSGKPRTRALRAVRDGRNVYAVALLGEKTAWLANIKANPSVTIRLGSKTFAATARRVTDPDERARAENAYRPVAGWYDWFDYMNFAWSIPTRGRLLAAHDRWFESGTVVAFDLPGDSV
jgi:deazaflavin-dependent oxidoreductase (nitroreductase family)